MIFFFIIPAYVCVEYLYMGQCHARCFVPSTITLQSPIQVTVTPREVLV